MTTVKELEAVIAAATDGPWNADGPRNNVIVWSSPDHRVCFLHSDGLSIEDGLLIAASRQALPNALRVIAVMKEALEWSSHRLDYKQIRHETFNSVRDTPIDEALSACAEFEKDVTG